MKKKEEGGETLFAIKNVRGDCKLTRQDQRMFAHDGRRRRRRRRRRRASGGVLRLQRLEVEAKKPVCTVNDAGDV